jgi:hypothetical protein
LLAHSVGQLDAAPLQTKGAQLGLPAPATSMQLPEAQLWQEPQEAELQQKPPTQLPVVHWLLTVQAAPTVLWFEQVPALQKSPAMQLALLVQLVGQPGVVPLQTKGEQDGFPAPVTSAQLPVAQLWQAPQLAEPQQKPPTQLPLAHSVAPVQAVPFAI